VGGERRRFLSGRAEHVHAAATGPALRAATGARTAAAEELKDFEKMRQEVHLYGAAACQPCAWGTGRLAWAPCPALHSGAADSAVAPATGAGALDKRQRKAFEAARLQSLNARADKAPRTTAAIGLGPRQLPLDPCGCLYVVLPHVGGGNQEGVEGSSCVGWHVCAAHELSYIRL